MTTMTMTMQAKISEMTVAQAQAALDNAEAYCRAIAADLPGDLDYIAEELGRIADLIHDRDLSGGRVMRALADFAEPAGGFATVAGAVERALALVGSERDPAPAVWRVTCYGCGQAYEEQGKRPDKKCGACGDWGDKVRVQFGGFAGETVPW